jgi:hypothetical protein
MSAQFRPISTIAFAFTVLALGLGVGVPPNFAFAVDCLTAPNSPAPRNGHWFYRTDRTQDTKCWYLRTDNGPSEQGAAQTAREAAKPSQSVVASGSNGLGFKDFVAQHAAVKLSDQDVDKLYADFLEWKRRAKN